MPRSPDLASRGPTATRSPMASDAISSSITMFTFAPARPRRAPAGACAASSFRDVDGAFGAVRLGRARLVGELGRYVGAAHHSAAAVVGLAEIRSEHIATPVPGTHVGIDRDPHCFGLYRCP